MFLLKEIDLWKKEELLRKADEVDIVGQTHLAYQPTIRCVVRYSSRNPDRCGLQRSGG